MKVLLDTHAFLWFVLGDARISRTAREVIENRENVKMLSPASYWEIAIKVRLGKYVLREPYERFVVSSIANNGFLILPILVEHTAILTTLPLHHRDPFDRLIIAQAMVEGVPVVSRDSAFDSYPVHRIW